jgi:hypothetical protein
MERLILLFVLLSLSAHGQQEAAKIFYIKSGDGFMSTIPQACRTVCVPARNRVEAVIPDEYIGLEVEIIVQPSGGGDSAYLASIPGMAESIGEGVATPLSECVPLRDVWPDV